MRLRFNVVFLLSCFHFATPLRAAVDFVRDVRPIFERYCYECHGPDTHKNGFRLDVKREAFHGGDEHAPNLISGNSAQSPLFRFVSGADEKVHMPPKKKGKALSAQEIATLQRWLDEGAVWPDEADKVQLASRTDWWSFKPLTKPPVPKIRDPHSAIENPIDLFIVAKLEEHGLQQSPEADARTLIRRITFDLTGLPPEIEETEMGRRGDAEMNLFSVSPPLRVSLFAPLSDETLEVLTDRLLASPRYGERWARHWLDVVHYGETHGYDKDKPRPHAWPYRDYVIRALNNDKPYARFVQEQLAGDVMFPGTADGIVALGFIAAGPWDLIGHMEVPETKIDGMIARHLDRDDMVQNTMGAFCSLTAGCAQCHDHKFDPITQEDYYALQATFAALDRTDVAYYPDDATEQRFQALSAESRHLTHEISTLEAPLIARAGKAYAELTRRIEGASDKGASPNARPDFGYHSAISKEQQTTKWVQVDLGSSTEIDKVVLMPCYDDFNKIGAGFGFPIRFKVECSDDPTFKSGVTLLWRKHDITFMNDFANPGLRPFETGGAKDDGVEGRYVRVTAIKLAPRKNDFIFALAELQVFDKDGRNLAQGKLVTALDSIEAPPRWRTANLTDGIAPESRTEKDRQQLTSQRSSLMMAQANDATRARLDAAHERLHTIEGELAKLPPPAKAYIGAVHTGTGNFKGTGGEGGAPRTIHVLKRGDVKNPGEVTGPGAVAALSKLAHLPSRFDSTSGEATRRAALAQWITAHDNPLVWRSIVNRVWQHHFGRPLVDTPNDFGRMGAQPSNPELLDWLAVTFRDDLGGSLKKLHKLIVMSHTYRQASTPAGQHSGRKETDDGLKAALQADAENHFLSHQNRRKLDAECIHDSILAVSGKLDLTMGGQGYQDFVVTHPEHSPHYEYDLFDPEEPKSHRRSIYRFIVRSQQQPFMTCLDCADPSMRVDKRNESLSPLQALALMNNGIVVTMARHFAERVQRECPGNTSAQVRHAFTLALSRPPTDGELSSLVEYTNKNGLENTCRVILNLNEFTFVD
jgi:hypothetical protein